MKFHFEEDERTCHVCAVDQMQQHIRLTVRSKRRPELESRRGGVDGGGQWRYSTADATVFVGLPPAYARKKCCHPLLVRNVPEQPKRGRSEQVFCPLVSARVFEA